MSNQRNENDHIHLVTYNTQFCTGLDGRTNVSRIASEVEKADIICLQEIDRYWKRTGMIDQAETIASHFPSFYWAFGPGIDIDSSTFADDGRVLNRRRQYGNMILSRWPLVTVRNHLLPKLSLRIPLSMQRAALEAVIDLPGRPCRIYSTHLAHSSNIERQMQISCLLSIIDHSRQDGGSWSGMDVPANWESEGPRPPSANSTILAGDLNFTPETNEYAQLCDPIDSKYGPLSTSNGLSDGWLVAGHEQFSGCTWVHEEPPRRLDYIMVSTDVAVRTEAMWVDSQATGSDHKPLWSQIQWP